MKGETATPRRVSAALLDDCDKGTWNLSIYCNRSGRPSITYVTWRDPTLDKGRAPARSGVACPKNVQRQYLACPSELVWSCDLSDDGSRLAQWADAAKCHALRDLRKGRRIARETREKMSQKI